MAALEELSRLSSLLTRPPIHEGSSNICLNARFATEPFRAVEVLDDLLPLTGAPQSD